ncbi:hypothetical protein V8B97DRAFT_2024755 [Scleroderma yunnanense]
MPTIDFGVKYTPSTVHAHTLVETPLPLEDLGIKYVRVQWVDLSSHIHCRVLTLSHFYKLLQSARPGVNIANAALGIVFLNMTEGFYPAGEYLLAIDRSSLRLCGYAPGHASVFGFFEEKVAIGGRLDVPLCPRTNLRRTLKYAEEELNVQFLVGFETEFILLKSTDPLQVVNNYGWSRTAAFGTGTTEAKVLEEIAEALTKSGVELQMFHSEGAPGQYEVITGPLSPLEAADALVHTRETIYNIATKHGLRATLAPRLHLDSCGSGAHTHISIHPTTGTSPPSQIHPSLLTTLEYHFLAGLMAHLPSVIAFTLPLPQSYSRMVDGIWSGGTWACWGLDHREVPVRVANPSLPHARNFEIKSVDGTASPYLALEGLLSAGIIGVRDKLALEVECCAEQSAAQLSVEERAQKGITKRLPLDVDSARRYLLEDQKIGEVIGEDVVKKFVAVNKTLGKAMQPEAENEAVTLARLLETY